MSKTIEDFKNLYSKNKIIENFKLHEMINEALSTVNATLSYNNITLHKSLDENISLKGCKSELEQSILIIINNAKDALLSNAIQNPKIDISLYKDKQNNTKIIKIYNNAGGIDKKIQDKIFNPYFSTKHKSKGTGIGLHISKMIIENEMDGSITFENEDDEVSFYIIFKGAV